MEKLYNFLNIRQKRSTSFTIFKQLEKQWFHASLYWLAQTIHGLGLDTHLFELDPTNII